MAATDEVPTNRRGGRSLPRENPLIPHPVMRRLFGELVACDLARLNASPRTRRQVQRESACWTAVFTALSAGDAVAAHTGLLAPLLAARAAQAPVLLPTFANPLERVLAAVGAAAASGYSDEGRNVCALSFTADEASASLWKRLLSLATENALPILVMLMPNSTSATPTAARATTKALAKTPLLPVDTTDVVGIYRAVQESLLRLRNGGGIVVVQCLETGEAIDDPLLRMEEYLLVRRFPVARWQRAARTA